MITCYETAADKQKYMRLKYFVRYCDIHFSLINFQWAIECVTVSKQNSTFAFLLITDQLSYKYKNYLVAIVTAKLTYFNFDDLLRLNSFYLYLHDYYLFFVFCCNIFVTYLLFGMVKLVVTHSTIWQIGVNYETS